MKNLAPILLLGYKRPLHLKLAIESLLLNPEAPESILYVAIDGPKTDEELDLVEECRAIATSITGFKKVITSFQETNIGLANSVIMNVSQVLIEHETIIVVEDDLVVSEQFLAFTNLGLEAYAKDLDVASIHGYQYPLKISGNNCVFLRGADCWGWATWKDRWSSFNFSADALIGEILDKKLKSGFDLYGAVSNFSMLQNQASHRIDSWAIRWHASMYIQEKYTLYPPSSLVLNCGLDGSGTHEGKSQLFRNELVREMTWVFPPKVQESQQFRNRLILFYMLARAIQIAVRLSSWPSKLLKLIAGKLT